VDAPPRGGAHRLQLALPPCLLRTVGGPVGLALHHLASASPVAGRIDRHALSVLEAAERRAVADQLEGVDRLAAAADQESDLLALYPADDLLGVLVHLDARVEVEGFDHP